MKRIVVCIEDGGDFSLEFPDGEMDVEVLKEVFLTTLEQLELLVEESEEECIHPTMTDSKTLLN